ncbi:MAG: hypothetical protein IJ679_06865, partial [Lachnospiraceae bacterium]|nr:hypothetical protein [Lachnospiraceae bacterium]
VNLSPTSAFEAPAVEASDDLSAEELDAGEEEIEVEEEAIEDEASSEDFEETEAEEAEEESNEDLADAEEAAAEEPEDAVEEATEETIEDAVDEAGNGSDVSEDQPISDAIISDEALSDEADALNEDAEEVEEVEAVEEVASEEADTLNDSDAIGPKLEAAAQGDEVINDISKTTSGTDRFSVNASMLQGVDAKVEDGKITGTLKYQAEPTDANANHVSQWWGSGYFFAYKISEFPAGAQSVYVGLDPSYGVHDSFSAVSGTDVDANSSSDGAIEKHVDNNGDTSATKIDVIKDGYISTVKITNKNKQKLYVKWRGIDGLLHTDWYDLSGLTLEMPPSAADEVVLAPIGSTETAKGVRGDILQTNIEFVGAGNSESTERKVKGTLNYNATGVTPDVGAAAVGGYYLAFTVNVPTATDPNDQIASVGVGMYDEPAATTGRESLRKVLWKQYSATEADNEAEATPVTGYEHTFKYVVKVDDIKNSKLRVVASTAEITGEKVTDYYKEKVMGTGSDNKATYEAFYDLSKLTLDPKSATVSGVAVKSVSRRAGDNSPIYEGDTVYFTVSGTIDGAFATKPSLSIRINGEGFRSVNYSVPDADW